MDTVTELLNLYFICIDKDILSKKIVQDGMDSVVEFISLMFTGKFRDKRFLRSSSLSNNTGYNIH